ncbi:hypothetical protein J8I26_12200 [Herbaspirillum sp. LeCh32-8]|uniref:hypothetical protein n=1 Tax=Herbaspirillum sp. LeCh32-8 TaxID=2821356 RepID=UPI001AE9E1EB|nr:hypothetical protein [Herbaspirillum sp. LeCh32-8]MBP0598873.1 hypothetical protein [Herbaspirillum sp. LeCh32-8]
MQEYFDALQRIKDRTPARISKDVPISLKSVAEEAGKHRSSIVRSRTSFATLIAAIEAAEKVDIELPDTTPSAAEHQAESSNEPEWKDEAIARLTHLLEESICREISLVEQVANLQREINALNAGNVSPFSQKNST